VPACANAFAACPHTSRSRQGEVARQQLARKRGAPVKAYGEGGGLEAGGSLIGDFNAGADKLATLEFTDSSTQDIKGGNGVSSALAGAALVGKLSPSKRSRTCGVPAPARAYASRPDERRRMVWAPTKPFSAPTRASAPANR